jgi:uncharacterized protein (TIGR03000 family)
MSRLRFRTLAVLAALTLLLAASASAAAPPRWTVSRGGYHAVVAPRPPIPYPYGGSYGGYYRGYSGLGYRTYNLLYYYPRVAYYGSVPAVTVDLFTVPATSSGLDSRTAAVSSALVPTVSEAPPPLPENTARLRIRVPADASLWVDGEPMPGSGPERVFLSPPLLPGRMYTYEVRARWTKDGREVEQVRRALVRANETTVVDFTSPVV